MEKNIDGQNLMESGIFQTTNFLEGVAYIFNEGDNQLIPVEQTQMQQNLYEVTPSETNQNLIELTSPSLAISAELSSDLNIPANSTPQEIQQKEININNLDINVQQMADLLSSWGLECLFDQFHKVGIDIDYLQYMRYEHIGKFFEPSEFGKQMKFEHCLISWQKENHHTLYHKQLMDNIHRLPCEEVLTITAQPALLSQMSNKENKNHSCLSIQNILDGNDSGKIIKQFFMENNFINNSHRENLCTIIVEFYLIIKNIKPTTQEIKAIAEEIVTYFKGESLNTYFLHRGHKPPLGMLYNKFKYQIRKLAKFLNTNSTPLLKSKPAAISIEKATEYYKVKAEYETSNDRITEMLKNEDATLLNIFEEWPLYKHPFGPEFINIDFQNMYPNCQSIYSKWDVFLAKIHTIFNTNIKHDEHKKYFIDISTRKEELNADTFNMETMKLLSALLPPSISNVSTNKNKELIKFSIKDSQKWFFTQVESTADMNIEVDQIQKACIRAKTPLQPLLIIIGKRGEETQFMITIDGYKYICGSFLEALDVIFKMYQIFKLEYPKPCYNVWIFIQSYFYNIKTLYDKAVPSVITLITDLENH